MLWHLPDDRVPQGAPKASGAGRRGFAGQRCGQGTGRSRKARLGGRWLCSGGPLGGFHCRRHFARVLPGAVNQPSLPRRSGTRTGAHTRPAAAAGLPPPGSINQAPPPQPESCPRGLLCVCRPQAWEAGRSAPGSRDPGRVPMCGQGRLGTPPSRPHPGTWCLGPTTLICRASLLVGQRPDSCPLCGFFSNTVTPERGEGN